jgi:hypothetical protein
MWFALTLTGTASARADEKSDAEAKALFQAGREAFDGGRYEVALARWQDAYDLSGRTALLYNIGLAHDRLRHDGEALSAFKTYLAQIPQADNRDEVEGRIRALEAAQREREEVATPPAVAVPTAEEAARRAPLERARQEARPAPRTESREDRSVTSKWWFWTGVGLVVAGGIVAGVAVASSASDKEGAPIESRTGITIMALEAR